MRFQSTLPRGERRRNAGEPGKVFIISIHAPARGATHSGITLDISIHLFQSTLPRGERRYGSASNPADTDYFNPRSREGSDKPRKPRIHAINYFNPRSREGSDHVGFQHALAILLFQSTLPRGERLDYMNDKVILKSNFNPRSREGSDCNCTTVHKSDRNFNPRSREGSDREGGEAILKCDNFNPRSREGSDLYLRLPSMLLANFNPRSREGSDLNFPMTGSPLSYFNPRSREGSDPFIWIYPKDVKIISIHAPARGATR